MWQGRWFIFQTPNNEGEVDEKDAKKIYELLDEDEPTSLPPYAGRRLQY